MMDLLFEAASIHREHHDQTWFKSRQLSIKQADVLRTVVTVRKRYHTEIEGNDLMSQVKAQALRAKSGGSSRVWEQRGET
jgi:biotin synthase